MLQVITHWFVYSLLGLDPQSRWAGVLEFFIYDSLKILILLFVMIFAVGVLRSFIPMSAMRQWLVRKKGAGNLLAAVFGAVTPFCSCSSIPIFLSFLKAGVPLGVGFSFLITSPLINEYLVVLMLGFFGWKITVAYVVNGLMLGAISGMIIGKMDLEVYIEKDMSDLLAGEGEFDRFKNFYDRLSFGYSEAVSIVRKVWGWVLAGVALGALIHNYVPQESVEMVMRKAGPFSVPLAALLGVPLYAGCAAIIPVAVVLFQKGIPLGTALAFMMAASALSLPEAVMLRRAMKLKLIVIFFGIVTGGIIVTGYIFNFLQDFILFGGS